MGPKNIILSAPQSLELKEHFLCVRSAPTAFDKALRGVHEGLSCAPTHSIGLLTFHLWLGCSKVECEGLLVGLACGGVAMGHSPWTELLACYC